MIFQQVYTRGGKKDPAPDRYQNGKSDPDQHQNDAINNIDFNRGKKCIEQRHKHNEVLKAMKNKC